MRLLATLTCIVWSAVQLTAFAQLSSDDARKLQLEVAWQSQVQMPRASGLASAHLWAEESNPRRYAVVELPGRTIRVAVDKLDRSGNPIGMELAKKQALQEAQFRSWDVNGDGLISRAEAGQLGSAFAEIDRDGDGRISFTEYSRFIDWTRLITSTLGATDAARMLRDRRLQDVAVALTEPTGLEAKELIIPRLKLVLVSRSGAVETLDAETGSRLWSTYCGDSRAPAFPAGVSKAGIVVVQGDHLYVLDWETGKQLEVKRLANSTANAVAVTDEMAFVADSSGRVEAYGIGESTYIQRWGYSIRGRAIGNTFSILDKDLCAIGSNAGFLYVFNGTEVPSVWMRYQSSTPIVRCLGVGNGGFYAGNLGGKLSKIVLDDRLGRIRWEYLSGQSLSTPPLIVGNQVFVAADNGSLFCVDDEEGRELWVAEMRGIAEPLAVVNNTVFCRTQSNEIFGFNITTGAIAGRTSARILGNSIPNALTNRLYTLGIEGEVQCLRPIGGDVPVMVTAPVVKSESEGEEETAQPVPEGGDMQPGSNPFEAGPAGGDPFGSGADPFGAGNSAAGAGANAPANAPANPFGADPFGSGN
jgi:outer membrane protein assembly factor BamB